MSIPLFGDCFLHVLGLFTALSNRMWENCKIVKLYGTSETLRSGFYSYGEADAFNAQLSDLLFPQCRVYQASLLC